MYTQLLNLYLTGRLSDAGLDSAVTKRWITAEQAAEIRQAKADADSSVAAALLTSALEPAA